MSPRPLSVRPFIVATVLAMLLVAGGCASAPDPKLIQAAKWRERRDKSALASFEADYYRRVAADPLYRIPDGADVPGVYHGNPMIDTPYGRYRISVLKKVSRELEEQHR